MYYDSILYCVEFGVIWHACVTHTRRHTHHHDKIMVLFSSHHLILCYSALFLLLKLQMRCFRCHVSCRPGFGDSVSGVVEWKIFFSHATNDDFSHMNQIDSAQHLSSSSSHLFGALRPYSAHNYFSLSSRRACAAFRKICKFLVELSETNIDTFSDAMRCRTD